jgi:hypothetical protein
MCVYPRLADHLRETYDGTPPDEDATTGGDIKGGGDGETEASEHPEPEVDEMRSQRDTILKRYIQV